jgi:hypothetical protein
VDEILESEEIEAFGVWPANQLALELSMVCHWERALGAMGGRVWHGLRASEAESVMNARSVEPPARWRLLQQMMLFVDAACRALNEWEAEKAEERRQS